MSPIPTAARVSRYHLTAEARATIARRAAAIRADLHWHRAQRLAAEALATMKRGQA